MNDDTLKPDLERQKMGVLAVVGFVFCLGMALTLNNIEWVRYRSDFFARWYAADKLLDEGRSLYDRRNGEEVVAYSGFPDPLQAAFYYPAHLLLFMAPFSLLPYPLAHLIWTAAVQLFYLAGLALVMRRAGWPSSANGVALFMVPAVLFLPYFQHTIWGQFNTIAVLSLALCWYTLQREQYGRAGVWAVGLTFKPQATLLTLLFLLFWALCRHERRRFVAGFAAALVLAWLSAEFLQPGWIGAFRHSLADYIPVQSVVDGFWNPYQIVAGALLLAAAVLFWRHREQPPQSAVFGACLALSVTVWFLIAPIYGMLHIVLLPLALIWVVSGLQQIRPDLYRPALYLLLALYCLGLIGFLWGVTSPERYGLHITLSELAYKTAAPILLALLALPVLLVRRGVVYHASSPGGQSS
jgi:hypothetical protein